MACASAGCAVRCSLLLHGRRLAQVLDRLLVLAALVDN